VAVADSPDQLVTVAELAIWVGGAEFDEDDILRAQWIIRVISGWAREVAGKLWANRDDCPITAKGIVLSASRREFENPKHVVYEVKGPESSSYNQQAYPPGFFDSVEEKYLKKFSPRGGLWSQSTYRDDPYETMGYVRILGSSKPIPYYFPGDPGWEESEHL
jgi:hypothetical protein